MKLRARQKYDYRDIDATEAKLIRIGHHLWRDRAKSRYPVIVVDHALEDVWAAKRIVRAELKVARAEKWNQRRHIVKNT
jgi:hypothetical protein